MTLFYKRLVFIFVIAFMACNEGGRGILPVDKMKVVFLHQIMAEEMVNNFFASKDTSLSLDSLYIVSFEKALKLNGTDSAAFFKSLAYYRQDIDRFKELMDSTYAYADRLRQIRNLKNSIPDEDSIRAVQESAADTNAVPDTEANDVDSLVN
jgi:hypothetical protein